MVLKCGNQHLTRQLQEPLFKATRYGNGPLDQRGDDAWSLTTDWPVAAATEIMGHVVVKVSVTSDQPVAYLSVKLNDVWPDGASALVTRGLLNLTHRVDPPAVLVAGQAYEIEVEMEATSWVFPAGHSIRLSVAGNDCGSIFAM